MRDNDMSLARRIVESPALATAVIVAMGVGYAVLARFVLHGVPYTGDEYSMTLQSDLFAHGMLKAPAPPHAEWLATDQVIINACVYSKYPPGTSALLAVGRWFGAPWAVTPVEATITLTVVWHTVRRLYGRPAALACVLLLGFAPLYVCTAASFHSHTPTLMFLSVTFFATTSWVHQRRDRWLILAGGAIGCAFLVRPFDALLFGVAMTSLRSWRALVVTVIGALPFVTLHLVYQHAQFGSAFTDGYTVYEPAFRAIYGDIGGSSLAFDHFLDVRHQWNHIDIIENMLFGATVLGAPIMAVTGGRRSNDEPMERIRTLCVALIVVYVVALLFTIAEPDDAPRARYLTITLLPLTVLASNGCRVIWSSIRTRLVAGLGVALTLFGFAFAVDSTRDWMAFQASQIWHRTAPSRLAESLPANAIIIIRAMFPTRFARNGPFFDGVLYLSVPRTVPDEAVRAAYPDRPIFSAREARPWKFLRVQ